MKEAMEFGSELKAQASKPSGLTVSSKSGWFSKLRNSFKNNSNH